MNARVQLEDIDPIAVLRTPPHSIEAESSVLGGLLLNNDSWDRVGDILVDSDFYRYEHRLVYAAIGQLVNASRSADVLTVFVQLQEAGKADEVGGLPYLNALAQYVPSAGNIRRYAEVVRERSILRQLVSASDEIATAAFNPQGKSLEAILDAAEQKIFGISESKSASADEWQGVDAGIVGVLDRIQSEHDGTTKPDIISTGIHDLDEKLDGGMRPGEVIVIGARPSMGKSALALSIGLNTALAGEPTGLFSMEMPKTQVWNRAMAVVSHIHLSRIKRPERLKDYDWPSLTEAVEKLRRGCFYVNDQSGLTILQVRAKARSLKRKFGLRVLAVDYLGLMNGVDPKQPRAYQLEDITKGLKALAKELGIVVLLLVQVKRSAEERADQMPILSDLRDSGAIEQDADIVVFVHRPIKAKPDLGDEWKYYAKVSIAKARDSEPGYLDLMYVGENTRFMNWPTDQAIPSSQVRTAKAKPL